MLYTRSKRRFTLNCQRPTEITENLTKDQTIRCVYTMALRCMVYNTKSDTHGVVGAALLYLRSCGVALGECLLYTALLRSENSDTFNEHIRFVNLLKSLDTG